MPDQPLPIESHSHHPIRIAFVLVSAAMAVVLPLTLLLLPHVANVDRWLSAVVAEHRWVRWSALSVMLLLAVECHCGSMLARLIRAGGNPSRMLAMEAEPARVAIRRRRKLRALSATAACLVAFVVAEIAFRAFNIRPAEAAPSPFQEAIAVDNRKNKLGLREDWDALAEDDRRWRVAVLGDSMTFGDSVEREDTFCHQMEAMLNGRVPGGAVTINMGKPGTVPREQLDLYTRVRGAIRPDVVLHVVYPNDLDVDSYGALKRIYRIRDDALYVGEWSYVLRFMEKQVRYWVAWNQTIDYFRGGRDAVERERAWSEFQRYVRGVRAAVLESGADYVLVLFPWLFRLDDYLLSDVHDRMRRFAADMGVPYLDLLEAFAGRDAESLRVSLANEHPNREGHRIAAERLTRFLLEEMLPRRGVRPVSP